MANKKVDGYMAVAGGTPEGDGGDAVDCSTKRDVIAAARELLRDGWDSSGITAWALYPDGTKEQIAWDTKKRAARGKRLRQGDLRIAEANMAAARAARDEAPHSALAAANMRDAHEALLEVQQRLRDASTK